MFALFTGFVTAALAAAIVTVISAGIALTAYGVVRCARGCSL